MANFNAARSVKQQYDLAGRVCIITGGSGFLGRQFAEGLGEMGAVPVLFDVAQEALQSASAQVQEFCGRCETEVVDVTDEASLRAATRRVLDRHGRIDVLVNTAALTKYGCDADPEVFFAPFENTEQFVWESGLRTNITGTMLPCKVIGPVMVKQRKGSIINIGSDVGIISPDQRIYQPDPSKEYAGMPFNTPAFYSTSKAAVIHLSRHLATLWAPHNVRVNAFSPAGVYRDHDQKFADQLSSRIPLGRMGAINEYKGGIVFLASDASSFMTGHNLVMDGGRTIW